MNRDSRQNVFDLISGGHFLRSLQDDRWMELKIIAATIFEQESMKTCKAVHPRSFYPRRATGRPDSAEPDSPRVIQFRGFRPYRLEAPF